MLTLQAYESSESMLAGYDLPADSLSELRWLLLQAAKRQSWRLYEELAERLDRTFPGWRGPEPEPTPFLSIDEVKESAA